LKIICTQNSVEVASKELDRYGRSASVK